jgi:hypothetical protein
MTEDLLQPRHLLLMLAIAMLFTILIVALVHFARKK